MARRIVIEEPCVHGFHGPHVVDKHTKDELVCWDATRRVLDPGSYLLVEKVDDAIPAWVGDSNVDELQDLVYDRYAHVIDVSRMDPVWIIERVPVGGDS